jgi:hypothetical protein
MLICGRVGAAEAVEPSSAQTASEAVTRTPGKVLILRRIRAVVWSLADIGESILRGSAINVIVSYANGCDGEFLGLDASNARSSAFAARS